MEKEYPLVSILVLCYNNQQFIYENLKSIFEQTYPNLEVLIGDDASEDFDAESLILWIDKNRSQNIKHITIYENRENLGTVANLERLQKESRGEYLFQIAADDAMFDREVIRSFYDMAVQLGERGEYITAQTEMWDHALKHKTGDFLQDDWIELIKNGSARDIFAELSWHICLPACGFYRREMLDKIGNLSEKYNLVEDWTWALRMTRLGIKPYYLETRPSIKHRDGGISHGNNLHSQRTFLTCYHDILNSYTTEVAPYEDLLTPEERKRARQYYQDRIRAYYRIHLPKYVAQCEAEQGASPTVELPQETDAKKEAHVVQVQRKGERKEKEELLRGELKKTVFQISSWKTIFYTFMAGLLCMIACAQANVAGCEKWLCQSLLCAVVALLAVTVVEVVLNIWLGFRHLRQRLNER